MAVIGAWELRPCAAGDAAALARDLGVSELTASVLVRRGYADAADARRFLAGEMPPHDPLRLGDMRAACERIRAAVARGERVCVHGDYDVDGICSTTLLTRALRGFRGKVVPVIPHRLLDGYELGAAGVDAAAAAARRLPHSPAPASA